MHNGNLESFRNIRKKLISHIDDDIYVRMNGSTDSEHLFGIFLKYLKSEHKKNSSENLDLDSTVVTLKEMVLAVIRTVKLALDLVRNFKSQCYPSSLNLCVTDGDNLVVSRFRNCEDRFAIAKILSKSQIFH